MREDHEVEKSRALDRETYAGVIDAAGGHSLACALPKIAYGGSVAAIGLAAGNALNTTVVPFLLRGVNILGIDSVMAPKALRQRIWARLAIRYAEGTLGYDCRGRGLDAIPSPGQGCAERRGQRPQNRGPEPLRWQISKRRTFEAAINC